MTQGTLTVCLAKNGGPMSSRRARGGRGLDYALSQAIAERLGLDLAVAWFESEPEEESSPVRETYAMLAHGVCDLAPGFALYRNALEGVAGTRATLPRWDERPTTMARNFHVDLQPVAVTRPYLRGEIALVAREGEAAEALAPLLSLDRLPPLRFGIAQGTLGGAILVRRAPDEVLREAVTANPGPSFLWRMENGEFDATLVSTAAYDMHRKQNALTALRLMPYRHRIGYHLGVAGLSANEALVKAADRVIAELDLDGLREMAESNGITWARAARLRRYPAPDAGRHRARGRAGVPMKRLALAWLAVLFTFAAHAQTAPLRLGALKFGTVNWELDTIQANGLDEKHGFTLEVVPMGGGSASKIAFEGGAVDAIVSDWLWVARQRAAGRDYVFMPYSTAVGAIVVPPDSPLRSLADLKGKRVGIGGGPLDKSWLVLQAYAKRELDLDLAGAVEPVFGAPPLIYKSALQGRTDAMINYWHFLARAEAKGFRRLVTVADAAAALGLSPDTPLLGFVMREADLARRPEWAGLLEASREAKELLRDDAAWEALRGRVKPVDEAEFTALKAGFRAGIPAPGPVDVEAADAMLKLMREVGGTKLVGDLDALPANTFFDPEPAR